jgi:hypothetical protein
VQADQLEDAAQGEMLRRPGSPSKDCSGSGSRRGVLFVLVLAGLILPVAAGLVSAALPILVGLPSRCRVGLPTRRLLAGGLVTSGASGDALQRVAECLLGLVGCWACAMA